MTPEKDYILDIDLDVFLSDIKEVEEALLVIKQLARQAKVITIATSPGFLNQQLAISFANRIVTAINN